MPQCVPMLGHRPCAGAMSAFDQGSDLEPGPECAGGDSDSSVSGAEESSRKQVRLTREHIGTEHSDDGSDDFDSSRSVREGPAHEHTEPSKAPEAADLSILRSALTARRAAMFDASRSGPEASGLDPVATGVTRGLVKVASEVLEKLLPADVKVLSKAFGNFDKVVALGRLLADAMDGRVLLEHKRAHAVGLKAKREVGRIKSDIDQVKRDARREACKLSTDDPKRQELLALAARAEDEAPLLWELADVGLSTSTAPACSSATGSRKRAREPDEPDEMSRAEAAVLECAKATKRADAKVESANKEEESQFKVMKRLSLKLVELSKKLKAKFSAKKMQQFNTFSELVREAEHRHHRAQMASKDALIFWLGALVKERDAELAVAELALDECGAE